VRPYVGEVSSDVLVGGGVEAVDSATSVVDTLVVSGRVVASVVAVAFWFGLSESLGGAGAIVTGMVVSVGVSGGVEEVA
jgi:hypothetical protein